MLSDTHDHLDKVRAAVSLFNRLEVDRVVHCGDFVAQFALVELSRLKMPLVGVYGNCDGDLPSLDQRAVEFGYSLGNGPQAIVDAGKRIVITHQPLDSMPDCDFYFHGHTHRLLHAPGRPAVVNPGEACGWLTGRATVALVDTDTRAVEFFDL